MDKFVKLGLVAVMLVAAGSAASADIQFTATYFEQHNWDNWNGTGTEANTNTDYDTDLWTLSLSEVAGETVNSAFYIDQVIITVPVDVSFTDDFGLTDHAGDDLTNGSYSVGGKTLTLNNLAGSLSAVGDSFNFAIDVDNTNAVVRGWYTGQHGSIAPDTTIAVTYFNGHEMATASALFTAGADPAHQAIANLNLQTAPLPGSLLLTGIGLGFMGVVRRFRKK